MRDPDRPGRFAWIKLDHELVDRYRGVVQERDGLTPTAAVRRHMLAEIRAHEREQASR
jgi:hypothetical protein